MRENRDVLGYWHASVSPFQVIALYSELQHIFPCKPFSNSGEISKHIKIALYHLNICNLHNVSIRCDLMSIEIFDWLIDCFVFYAVSAIFQPCYGGDLLKK